MVKKNGTYDSRRVRRTKGGGGEPLASSSRGESQSLKCVRELLYPHADGTLLLPARGSLAALASADGALLCYEPTQFQFCVCCYGIVWKVNTLLECKRTKTVTQ